VLYLNFLRAFTKFLFVILLAPTRFAKEVLGPSAHACAMFSIPYGKLTSRPTAIWRNSHLESRVGFERVAVVASGLARRDQQGAVADHLDKRMPHPFRRAPPSKATCTGLPFTNGKPGRIPVLSFMAGANSVAFASSGFDNQIVHEIKYLMSLPPPQLQNLVYYCG
jgi:hypothetical protein